MTKKENFMAIRELVIDNDELVAFVDHEIELLDRKSNSPRKPTKTQKENAVFKEDIHQALVDAETAVTMKELQQICPSIADLTTQRVTHILTGLIKEGLVEREIVKKVRYYKAV